MNEREWDKLFEFIEKAINLPNLTAQEKADKIREEAFARAQDNNLEEFITELTY